MNILVTGASKGIGKAIAEKLFGLGKVYVTARNEEALKQMKCDGYFVCDLADKNNLIELGSYIEEKEIDVLVNNAGEYIYSPLADTKIDELSHIMNVNLKAPIYLASRVVNQMKKKSFWTNCKYWFNFWSYGGSKCLLLFCNKGRTCWI